MDTRFDQPGFEINSGFRSPPLSRRDPYRSDPSTPRMAGRRGDERVSFADYPPTQPFINTDYRRDPNKPVDTFPESNRDAVMSALKTLQDKIRQLEVERSQAESNLRTIAHDTSLAREASRARVPSTPAYRDLSAASLAQDEGDFNGENRDLNEKLDSAEHRCNVLEKQLECMRKMVHSAETDRSQALRTTAQLQKQQAETEAAEIHVQLDKIKDLEREHLKLTATQTMADNKIRTLEERLREEKRQRRQMQDKAAELETAATTNRILLEAGAGTSRPSPRRVKKKKRAPSARKDGSRVRAHSWKPERYEPGSDHYRLNLAGIPFVAGKATGPSHAVGANFQEVLSIMKNHNNKLCKSPRQHTHNTRKFLNSRELSSSGISSGSDNELGEILLQLQDEFAQMSFEHKELTRQLGSCTDSRLREDLERELDGLVARMEAKGEQIARLRKHQEYTTTKPKKKSTTKTRPRSAKASMPASTNGEIQVTTTIKTKPGTKSPLSSYELDPGTSKAQSSLKLLKDLKKMQSTLRKDDLSWES